MVQTVLVTGATGLLGAPVVSALSAKGYTVVTHALVSPADCRADLSDTKATHNLLDQIAPTVIINLVGQISVELCQDQPNLAYLANTRVVENLVKWIQMTGGYCHLIQISSDHVYDGLGPHTEELVTLTNSYAFSKYAGELAAARVPSTILRTNFVGRSRVSHRESLTDWVHNSLTRYKNVQVLTDVFFTPLSMRTLSEMICLVTEKKPVGIYNLGSHNGMSKADFDFEFARCLGLQTETMSRIESTQASFLKAYRPKDMRMNVAKLERELGVTLPDLTLEIELAAKDYSE